MLRVGATGKGKLQALYPALTTQQKCGCFKIGTLFNTETVTHLRKDIIVWEQSVRLANNRYEGDNLVVSKGNRLGHKMANLVWRCGKNARE